MRVSALLTVFLLAAPLTHPRTACGQAAVDLWVDPGHGGQDKGNLGFDAVRVEKDIALQVSAHPYSQLANLGYSVYLTRLSDYSVPLEDRAAMASGDLEPGRRSPATRILESRSLSTGGRWTVWGGRTVQPVGFPARSDDWGPRERSHIEDAAQRRAESCCGAGDVFWKPPGGDIGASSSPDSRCRGAAHRRIRDRGSAW